MHTEEIRVRLAANDFRCRLEKIAGAEFANSEGLLSAADKLTGYTRVTLPKLDPLLGRASALLDREFITIWQSNERPLLTRYVDAAHEYGHLVLHDLDFSVYDPLIEQVSGYSKNQRHEVDAHRFADEFLLPLNLARSVYQAGQDVKTIAHQLMIPRSLVIRQLLTAFVNDGVPNNNEQRRTVILDSWQEDAVRSEGAAVVLGSFGTGKTECLVGRCVELLESQHRIPSEVLLVTESKENAAEIRQRLLDRNSLPLALIPITTPYQLARDILVRFPVEAGLERGWEETDKGSLPSQFLDLALTSLANNSAIKAVVIDRISYLLVDNLDLFSSKAAKLLTVLFGDNVPTWSTCSQHIGITAANTFNLPYQYRTAAGILKFADFFSKRLGKRPIARRSIDQRCGDGSVTIAFSETSEQMLSGVKRLIEKKKSLGYLTEDFLVLQHRSSAASAQLVSQLSSSRQSSSASRYWAELRAVVELCSGNWSRSALIHAGQMPRYNIPVVELLKVSHNGQKRAPESSQSTGWKTLLEDISVCQKARSPREILEQYVFETANYLRENPDAGQVVFELMHGTAGSEKGENRSIRTGLFGDLRTRPAPIVIVLGSNLDWLKLGTDGSSELDAASVATDCLVFCTVTKTVQSAIALAKRELKGLPEVEIEDWDVDASRKAAPTSRPPELPAEEYRLFQQCPRRLYYAKMLDIDNQRKFEAAAYPPSPADLALCQNCLYADLCPVELS